MVGLLSVMLWLGGATVCEITVFVGVSSLFLEECTLFLEVLLLLDGVTVFLEESS